MAKKAAPQPMKCPYCGKERPRYRISKCFFCEKPLSEEYVMLIDEQGDRFGLCSTDCMTRLFETMEAEEFEEDE